MALITAFSLAGSTLLWPRLNQTEYAEAEVERLGVQALYKLENQRAVELLELSSRMKAAPARAWFNLGIAYQRVGKDEQALAAYERAARLPGADAEIITTATQLRAFMSRGR